MNRVQGGNVLLTCILTLDRTWREQREDWLLFCSSTKIIRGFFHISPLFRVSTTELWRQQRGSLKVGIFCKGAGSGERRRAISYTAFQVDNQWVILFCQKLLKTTLGKIVSYFEPCCKNQFWIENLGNYPPERMRDEDIFSWKWSYWVQKENLILILHILIYFTGKFIPKA
jgi:hypothetical protein